MLDGDFVRVVHPAFFERAFAHAAGELIAVGAREVEDLKDVDVFGHQLCLGDVARDAIEDEEVDVGLVGVCADA